MKISLHIFNYEDRRIEGQDLVLARDSRQNLHHFFIILLKK